MEYVHIVSFSINIILLLIPLSYAHFTYYIVINIYDSIFMISSSLCTIFTLLSVTIFSPLYMYSGSVSQVYLCIVRLLFTASNFSFCIVSFIILSHYLILVSFCFALLWFKNREVLYIVGKHKILELSALPSCILGISLYTNSSSVKHKGNSNFIKISWR